MSEESNITKAMRWFIGEDRVWEYAVTDAAGVAVDITGWALEWVMRDGLDGAALLTKTTGAGIQITPGTGGLYQVTIADTDTIDDTSHKPIILAGVYPYATRRTDPGSEVVLAEGSAVLQLAATR